ncbi:OmpA family protein [Rhodocyclus gracilis]|nr:OmpA family protein [Rhodocyclus gracilis]
MRHVMTPPSRTSARHRAGELLLAGALAAILAGCAPKSYVVLLESPDGTTGKVIVKGARGEQLISTARYGAPLDGSAAAAPVSPEKIHKDFGDAIAARPKMPTRYLLYFDNGARLTAESAALIPKIIAEAADRPAVDVSVIGHTDTSGRADGNEELSLRRATTVAKLLKDRGLKVHALSIESHGERNLLIPTPDNTYEPRNRRVEISIR